MAIKKPHFSITPNLLPKTDPRFIKWKKSLQKRPPTWCKGLTKNTDGRVRKISETMKKKKIDNFKHWRDEMINIGKIRSVYPTPRHTKKLAFFIGLVHGDGNITVFPRTECLTIALNTKYPKLVAYTKKIMWELFGREPSINRIGNCDRVRIYQKNISSRLGIPSGKRRYSKIGLPEWIWRNKELIISALKGYFEAEGSYSIHLPTCTYNFQFSNRNDRLRADVERGLKYLGYHPEIRPIYVRLRKKAEAESFYKLIKFRKYD